MSVVEKVVHEYNYHKNTAPTFIDVYDNPAIYRFYGGGRVSIKTKNAAQELMIEFMRYISEGYIPNIICVREIKESVIGSCFGSIMWAIRKMNLEPHFHPTPTSHKITHRRTGARIYFYGLNDIESVKGIEVGDISGVWFEEAAEMRGWISGYLTKAGEDIGLWSIIQSLNRFPVDGLAKNAVIFYFTYNPSGDPGNYINILEEQKKDNEKFMFHHSTYLDDKLNLIPANVVEEIKEWEKDNPKYYRSEYLGLKEYADESVITEIPIDDSDFKLDSEWYMGVDSAYTGKDGVLVTLGTFRRGFVRAASTFEIEKGSWVHGETGDRIADEIALYAIKYKVKQINVDANNNGSLLVEALHARARKFKPTAEYKGFKVVGVFFQAGVNKVLVERKHMPSIEAFNKRAELFLRLQNLTYNNAISVTSQVSNQVKDQIRIITFYKKENNPKKLVISKEEIRKKLKKSIDETDSLVLMIDAIYDHKTSPDLNQTLMITGLVV